MDRTDVQRWVEAYRVAWESNDPDEIGVLFTEDARYFTAPFREPWVGRETIVRGWIDRKDEPGAATFSYEVVAIDGDLVVVRGQTHYPKDDPPRYSNLWLIRLAEGGRASEFIEYWMGHE